MTDVSKIKAAQYSELNKLDELITLSDAGIYGIPTDLHEKLVLEPAGITVEQDNKRQKLEKELLGGMLYTTGNLAGDHFKANTEAVELGFSYNQGKDVTVSGVFNRDSKSPVVVHIETSYKTADVKRVLSYLGDHFTNIND
jgi:hypothetical protein